MTLSDIREPHCTRCKLSRDAEDICEMGHGSKRPAILVVSRMPSSETYQVMLDGHLRDAGIDLSTCHFTSALKCRNFEANAGKADLKACQYYLDAEIAELDPEWILVFGNEALAAVTGHSGIMKWRGRLLEARGRKVLATISPSAVSRNPGQTASYMADLRFFSNQILGTAAKIKPPKINYILTASHFKSLKRAVNKAELISFDLETTMGGEYEVGGAIVSIAVTCVIEGKLFVAAMPLYHPQSPFRKQWREAIKQLTRRIAVAKKRIAHNGKFDCRWMRVMGNHETLDITFDTMLAAHLLDENREKGLKPQATSRLGVAPWGIDTRDLLNTPIMEVLEYNALDTFYAYHIYLQEREELIAQPRLLRIFQQITMPAANKLIGVEQRGAWVDRERLATNGHVARKMLEEIDRDLLKFVPDRESPGSSLFAESESPWPTNSKGKQVEVNFNPSIFAKWFLFDHLGLPVLARGKEKDDGSPGDPSMAEGLLQTMRGHPVIDLMLKRVTWNKMVSAFFNSYDELLTPEDRIHTTFKIAGTVTGRLSSGKVDAEKITAKRPTRGVNLQQVPRDPLVRSLFGAPPGYTFVEADFSQIELRIAAFLSRDRTMLSLYQQGKDIHRATAAWVLGVPESQITKDDRKKAKAVNFGFVYGMGWRKFIVTAFEKYELTFTEQEAQEIRRLFFEQFKGLQGWHARQRRLVNENRRVQNPIGRVRHLPDIDSPQQGVRAEAERQAINSPVQSFGSDLCMLSLILVEDQFTELGINAYTIGTVHDALLFEVKDSDVAQALPLIKTTMENLPLDKMFGVHIDVPIIADMKVGTNWGEAEELSTEEVFAWAGSVR